MIFINSSLNGVITKGIGGFYYVDTDEGVIECRARGIFRKNGITPLVGDYVKITLNLNENQKGVIDEISERKNRLIRPPVSNVTQLAAVIAVASPKPNLLVLDKLIASAEYCGIKVLVCINKTDLLYPKEFIDIYEGAGFEVLCVSAAKNENVNLFKESLKDNITVFAGNSGVGKSSLINLILGYEAFEVGQVSEKVERGNHTTRHSELVPIDCGGYIIDTPGFSSFELSDITTDDLSKLFREFGEYTNDCRFMDCSHTIEEGCAVIKAVEGNKISSSRHESYVKLYGDLKKIKPWERQNGKN